MGVCVNHLGASHLSYVVLRNAGKALRGTDLDLIAFYEQPAVPCMVPPCALMPILELWGYDGVAIATTLSTAEKLVKAPGPSRKFFYCWDLEWMRMGQKSFESLQAVYGHPELELVARGKDHQKALQDAWNKSVKIADDFDLGVFLE